MEANSEMGTQLPGLEMSLCSNGCQLDGANLLPVID